MKGKPEHNNPWTTQKILDRIDFIRRTKETSLASNKLCKDILQKCVFELKVTLIR